ncbi:hypothetical protein EI42_05835 [Thermosporothrix hazakensis]|jgi:hypothetical protein|uniref:Uncharacterized protein n=1 Tax=Thermosporothrix hazakensis TaxID=644383 RepID=A0A326TUW7_THEHA|nr:hypothetical protein EI42_05835 [Thermosporothrix hazakensis]
MYMKFQLNSGFLIAHAESFAEIPVNKWLKANTSMVKEPIRTY